MLLILQIAYGIVLGAIPLALAAGIVTAWLLPADSSFDRSTNRWAMRMLAFRLFGVLGAYGLIYANVAPA
jgi:hypothetical protein